jgi:pyruvate/2-oxoglutarate/acetoin dehydrogenase E1 component
VIDLRTIMPLDVGTVAKSVAKTHRLLVVDEGWGAFGVGAEMAQAMNELAFDDLDAPVGRSAYRSAAASPCPGAGTRHADRCRQDLRRCQGRSGR